VGAAFKRHGRRRMREEGRGIRAKLKKDDGGNESIGPRDVPRKGREKSCWKEDNSAGREYENAYRVKRRMSLEKLAKTRSTRKTEMARALKEKGGPQERKGGLPCIPWRVFHARTYSKRAIGCCVAEKDRRNVRESSRGRAPALTLSETEKVRKISSKSGNREGGTTGLSKK